MRLLGLTLLLELAACSASDQEPRAAFASGVRTSENVVPSVASAANASRIDAWDNGAPFDGVWEQCDEDGSPHDCSRYRLVARGNGICGTWSYVATADYYEGQLQVIALWATTARRTKVCGRPGSETQTECESGWESIDKPLGDGWLPVVA